MHVDPRSKKRLEKLGRRIRTLRLAQSWTLEQTEEHGWKSWRHLQKIEAGKNITVVTLFSVAKLYKIHPSELLKEI